MIDDVQPQRLAPETIAVIAGRPNYPGAPLNQPLVLASNFRQGGEYSRVDGTETWVAFESAIGALEGGKAVAFASGMAAASAAIYALAAKVVVIPNVSYMGVRALLTEFNAQGHVTVRPVNISNTDEVIAALDGADVAWVETPTNPTLDLADIGSISAAANARGIAVVVDSTFATPLLQQPLSQGATIVIHSGTKFIGGHSDLLIGVCITNDDAVYSRLISARTYLGATPGSLEAFLALRGLRTLPLRMQAAQRNAHDLVNRLKNHPAVLEVRYPGQGAMVSFVVRGAASAADLVCERVRIAVPATSLGGVETTIERRQKYAGDAHVDPGLLRMSVGIEHIEDLWGDLRQALEQE